MHDCVASRRCVLAYSRAQAPVWRAYRDTLLGAEARPPLARTIDVPVPLNATAAATMSYDNFVARIASSPNARVVYLPARRLRLYDVPQKARNQIKNYCSWRGPAVGSTGTTFNTR